MRKIRGILSISLAFLLAFGVLIFPSSASAKVACDLGKNINDSLTNVEIESYLFGYEHFKIYNPDGTVNYAEYQGEVNKGIRKLTTIDHSSVNNIMQDVNFRVDNSSGNLREGDFFTYKLDPANRLGAYVNSRSIHPENLYAQDPETKEEVVFAYASWDYENNLITYILTDFIEGKEFVDISMNNNWSVNNQVIKENGPYTFTDTFANVSYSKEFNIIDSGNAVQLINGTNFSNNSFIQAVDVPTETFELISYININRAPITGNFDVSYVGMGNDNVLYTPLDPTATVEVFEVPEGVKLSDTWGVDFSTLTPVEIQLVDKVHYPNTEKEYPSKGFIIENPGNKAYVVKIVNKFTGGSKSAKDNNEMFNTPIIVAGLNITDTGQPDRDSGFTKKLDKLDLLQDSGTTAFISNFCNRPRQIKILKVDADTKKPLEGVKFELKDSEGLLIDTIVTDANGEILTSKLPVGKYVIKEVEAKEGYLLLEDLVEIEITTSDQSVVEVIVENKPTPEAPKPEEPKPEVPTPEEPKPEVPTPEVPKPEVPKVEIPKVEITKNTNPKTGDNFSAVLYGALIVVAIGGVIFISKKKSK